MSDRKMSSLRSKIDRRRTGAGKKNLSSDNVGGFSEEDQAAKDGQKKQQQQQSDAEIDEGNSLPSRGSENKKMKPSKKAASQEGEEEEEEEFPEPLSSEESEQESDHKDDEDYNEDSHDDDDDDSEESYDEEDDDIVSSSKKRKSNRKAPVKRKGSRSSPRVAQKRRVASKKPRRSARGIFKYDNASSDDSSEEDVHVAPRKTPTRCRSSPRNKRNLRSSYKEVGSGEEHYSDSENGNAGKHNDLSASSSAKKRTPRRKSAAKAKAKINKINKDDSLSSEDDDDVLLKITESPRRKKKKIDSEEEEFVADNDKELEDDELEQDAKSDESFLHGVESFPSDSHAVGYVDSIDFCEDERSSDESDNEKTQRRETVTGNSARASEGPLKVDHHEYNNNNNSDSNDEIQPTPTKKRLSQEETDDRRRKSTPPKLPDCPSEHDEITLDPLPKIHVCYFSPDGKSRHCFALETLHKVATVSSHPQYRTNLSNQQQLTFLQPPHFRSAISQDLLDQIASRFGRQALDLNGDFYKRDKSSFKFACSDDEEQGYLVNFSSAHTDVALFQDRWREYQVRTMGSFDLYPCPVCYCVAHHCLKISDESDTDETEIPLPHEFEFDPMTVLGSPDNNDFEVAAAFCFKKISEVKLHLRQKHKCKTEKIDNECFMRYKIRKPDGLLQRYLAKSKLYGKKPQQGDMRRYWYDGNSELFIYLLYQVKLFEQFQEEYDDDDENDNNSDSNRLAKAESYFKSFETQAQDLWERIVAPFSHEADERDMGDFVNNDEVEGADDPYHMFNQDEAAKVQNEMEEQAQYYKERAEAQQSDSDNASRYADDDEVDEELDVENQPQISSESEDEWLKSIRNKKRQKSFETPRKDRTASHLKGSNRKKLLASGSKIRNANDSDDSFAKVDTQKPPATNRAILDDSD